MQNPIITDIIGNPFHNWELLFPERIDQYRAELKPQALKLFDEAVKEVPFESKVNSYVDKIFPVRDNFQKFRGVDIKFDINKRNEVLELVKRSIDTFYQDVFSK